jgi:hypothetical protein
VRAVRARQVAASRRNAGDEEEAEHDLQVS